MLFSNRNQIFREGRLSFLYSVKKRHSTRNVDNGKFVSFLMNKGNEFEDAVIDIIRSRLTENDVKIVPRGINDNTINMTKDYIRDRVPVICQGSLRDETIGVQGKPDLLIWSEYIPKIFDNIEIPEEPCYLVFDVKYTTILLRADGKHMTNDKDMLYYKTQCYLYTYMLNQLQPDVSPSMAYIIPKNYTYKSCGIRYKGRTLFEKLGFIDYENMDSDSKEIAMSAAKWVRFADQNYKTMTPETHPELLPNLSCESGYWNGPKADIAEKTDDITRIWKVNSAKRALLDGKDWRTMNISELESTLQLKGTTGKIIRSVLDVNIQSTHNVLPVCLEQNPILKLNTKALCYVDFETLSDIFMDTEELPNMYDTSQLFMVGCAHEDEDGKVVYKEFTANTTSPSAEKRIMKGFIDYVHEMGFDAIIYWSADKVFWDSFYKRHDLEPLNIQSGLIFFERSTTLSNRLPSKAVTISSSNRLRNDCTNLVTSKRTMKAIVRTVWMR